MDLKIAHWTLYPEVKTKYDSRLFLIQASVSHSDKQKIGELLAEGQFPEPFVDKTQIDVFDSRTSTSLPIMDPLARVLSSPLSFERITSTS